MADLDWLEKIVIGAEDLSVSPSIMFCYLAALQQASLIQQKARQRERVCVFVICVLVV